MRRWSPRPRRRAALAAAVMLAGTLAVPSTAAAEPRRWTYFESSYYLRIRAAAVEPAMDIPQPLVPGLGFSSVMLEKDVGEPVGFCQTRGIGAHYTDVVEQVVLGQNAGTLSNAGVFNPTEAADTEPDRFRLETLNSRKPQVRNLADGTVVYDIPAEGTGVRWQAACDDEAGGRATGHMTDAGGVQAAGSATSGQLDKKTGVYTGTSRAFVAGLETAGGTLDLVSSVMRVQQLPGQEARITYRIGTSGGTLASGLDVPAGNLTAQFNEAVRANAGALAALGPFGLTLVAPVVTEPGNSGRPVVNAPFLDLTLGLDARRGSVGHNNHLRLVNIDFDGINVGGTSAAHPTTLRP